jgi:hypothetical protein
MLAAIAIGLSVMVLAAAALLGVPPFSGLIGVGPSSPTSTSGGSPSLSAGPGPPMTAAQERLLARLPAAVKQDCAPASAAEGSAGGSVALHCQLPLSAAAEEVWVDEFPSPETLAKAFADAVARTRASPGECETTPLAHGSWEVPNVHAGKLLCYQEEGAAWLVWTYDDDRILVRARRGGDDWKALYAWWRQTAIFLR